MSVQSTKGNPFTKEEMAAARALLSLRSSAHSQRPQRACVQQHSSAPAQEPRPQRACAQKRQPLRPRRSTADYTPGIYTGQE
jgi:hypothetical protein